MPSTSNSTFTPTSYSPPLSPLTPLPSSPLTPTSSPEPASTALPAISPSHPSGLPKTSTPSAIVLGHEAGPSVRRSKRIKAEPDHEHADQDVRHSVVVSASHPSVETGLVEPSSKRRKLGVEPSPGSLPTDDSVPDNQPNSGKLDVEAAPSPPAETDAGHPELPLLEVTESAPGLGGPKEELPTEILQHIFLDVIERTIDDRLAYSRKRLANLHSLSKVSQRWRNIVHGCPALWAEVLDPREPSRKTFDQVLSRSGSSTPLEISIVSIECPSLCKRQWRDILARMDQIAHLELGLFGERKKKSLDLLQDALGKEAPMLESLCIGFEQDITDKDEGVLSVSLTPAPHDRLFAGYAPKLKELVFDNCALVSVDAGLTSLLGNLVMLTIDNALKDCLDFNHALRWWDLCRSGGLPLLEILSFRFLRRRIDSIPLPPAQDGWTPSKRGALPPYLGFLSLGGDLEACISLLNLMDVPASCTLHLFVESDDPNAVETDNCRTFKPQSEPAELVSSLSRLWKENTTPCLELEITVEQDIDEKRLRLSHRSANREIVVVVDPWDASHFYPHFFDHLSRTEHLPVLSAEALLTLCIGIDKVPYVDSTFAKFMMQLRSVTRLRLIRFYPVVLVAGRARHLFDLTPDDLDGPSMLPSDTCATLAVLPSVRHMMFPEHWLLSTVFADELAKFIAARCPPGEEFTSVGEPEDEDASSDEDV